MRIKPDTALSVSLEFAPGNVAVGRLAMARGIAYLQYSEDLIHSGLRLNPLAPVPDTRLIPAPEPQAFDGLHGVFADSLPDGWGTELLRRRAVAHGIDFGLLSILDRLACVGRNGPGALVYRPEIAFGADGDIDLDLLAKESLRVTEGKTPRSSRPSPDSAVLRAARDRRSSLE